METEIDSFRAGLYALLAALLLESPKPELLTQLRSMEGLLEFGLQEELAKALQELAQAAAIEPSELEQEFHDLFIGITRGELLPYGSWYLSGSLHGASLARLREDLHALGIEREPKQPEPEDHIAAISEVLALLIKERDARQREVFAKHLAPWASRFFDDLEKTHAARFYRAVAKVGKIFLGLESRYLGLER